jgi:serine/threonine protein kinase
LEAVIGRTRSENKAAGTADVRRCLPSRAVKPAVYGCFRKARTGVPDPKASLAVFSCSFGLQRRTPCPPLGRLRHNSVIFGYITSSYLHIAGKPKTTRARGLTLPKDSLELRDDLLACLPSLVIDRPLAESGQRVVYLAHFEDANIPPDVLPPTGEDPDEKAFLHGWEDWGAIVVKVVSGADSVTLARLQAETAILEEVRPASFPKLLYCNLFGENPVTDERLKERLYVSIEEFIDSSPLSDVVDQYRGDEKKITDLALGIANALVPLWVHHRKFVHRDVKPANLLIRRTGGVVVIDLGIVRETGAEGVTRDGWGQGPFTPGYAAPEQVANEKEAVTYKTDFFSIGVVMYRLLAGVDPFVPRPSMAMHEIMIAAASHDPPALTDAAGASQKFSDFVAKAMMKEPWQRHRTPALFIAELQALQKN